MATTKTSRKASPKVSSQATQASKNTTKHTTRQKSAVGKNYSISLFIPLIIVLGIIPLMVYMNLEVLPEEITPFWSDTYAADFFSYYKSMLLMFTAVYIIGAFAYFKSQEMPEQLSLKDHTLRICCGFAAVFAVLAIVSTLFAQYKSVALWGAPERHEGLIMLLIYLVLLLYSFWAYSNKPELKWIVLPLGLLILIQGFLGVFQFFGQDLFLTKQGMKLIIPEQYLQQGDVTPLFERGKIYGTLYHYNFMGSFGAMLAPFFLVLALFLKERKQQIFCAIIALAAFFVLFGSTSRAGIVGLALALICFLIFFGRKIIEHYKITLGCVAVAVVFVFGVNVVTGGVAFERIPSLLQDITAVGGSDKSFDYRDHIPIREINLTADSATFVYQEQTIVIKMTSDHKPIFYDAAGQPLAPTFTENVYDINGARFELSEVKRDGKVTDELVLGVYVNGQIQTILYNNGEGFCLTNNRLQDIHYTEAPAWGFQGNEKMGSSRGYIWSRSLPMLKDTILIGNGPDTFFAEFPQGDYLGKLYAYDTMQMIVDKAHNLYLQIALNEGVIALLAFLALLAFYLIDSIRLYALKRQYSQQQAIGAAIALGIIGYLGAGLFNDSIVSIAPIFWVLLGIGFAVNRLEKQEKSLEVE